MDWEEHHPSVRGHLRDLIVVAVGVDVDAAAAVVVVVVVVAPCAVEIAAAVEHAPAPQHRPCRGGSTIHHSQDSSRRTSTSSYLLNGVGRSVGRTGQKIHSGFHGVAG